MILWQIKLYFIVSNKMATNLFIYETLFRIYNQYYVVFANL